MVVTEVNVLNELAALKMMLVQFGDLIVAAVDSLQLIQAFESVVVHLLHIILFKRNSLETLAV